MKRDNRAVSRLARRLKRGFSFRMQISKTIYHFYYLLTGSIRRLGGIVFSLPILIVAFPILFFLFIRRLIRGKAVFRKERIYGKAARPLNIYYFNLKSPLLGALPLFCYVLAGRMSLTGPAIKSYRQSARVAGDNFLYSQRPGIFNLWYVRSASKIGHEGQQATEWEYLYKRTVLGDLLLILKYLPASLYHQESVEPTPTINLFDVELLNMTMGDALGLLRDRVDRREKSRVYFVNPDCFNRAFRDREYYNILKRAPLVFPDGIGINLAGKILKTPLAENVNGTDMFPFICRLAREEGLSIYLLGGRPGVAEEMKRLSEELYEGLNICGVHDGYFDHERESEAIIAGINAKSPDILLVAFGVPLQESWIEHYGDRVEAPLIMGVGGLFDFYSGRIKRAPRWMREVGLEWFYRFMQEPGRMWKRYFIGNFLFLFRLLRWKMNR